MGTLLRFGANRRRCSTALLRSPIVLAAPRHSYGHPDVLVAEAAWTIRVEQQRSPAARQVRPHVVDGCVHRRSDVLGRGPGLVGIPARRNPDITEAEATWAIRPEQDFPSVGTDGRGCVVRWRVEHVDANRGTEGLAVTRDGYGPDVLIVQIESSTEVQSGCVCRNVSTSLQVEISALYVVRDEFAFLRVDVRTQVRRRLPPEVIVRVVAARHPDVDAAVPTGTGAMKKQQVAVRGKRRSPVLGGTVDDCQIEGLLPGTIGTVTLGNPDVGKALPARLPPGHEVETESVG